MEERNIKDNREYNTISDNYDNRVQNGSISMSMDVDKISSDAVSLDSD